MKSFEVPFGEFSIFSGNFKQSEYWGILVSCSRIQLWNSFISGSYFIFRSLFLNERLYAACWLQLSDGTFSENRQKTFITFQRYWICTPMIAIGSWSYSHSCAVLGILSTTLSAFTTKLRNSCCTACHELQELLFLKRLLAGFFILASSNVPSCKWDLPSPNIRVACELSAQTCFLKCVKHKKNLSDKTYTSFYFGRTLETKLIRYGLWTTAGNR